MEEEGEGGLGRTRRGDLTAGSCTVNLKITAMSGCRDGGFFSVISSSQQLMGSLTRLMPANKKHDTPLELGEVAKLILRTAVRSKGVFATARGAFLLSTIYIAKKQLGTRLALCLQSFGTSLSVNGIEFYKLDRD